MGCGRWALMSVRPGTHVDNASLFYGSIITLSRFGLGLASMSAENEIVMVGGIDHSTDEVFPSIKVIYVLNKFVSSHPLPPLQPPAKNPLLHFIF